MTSQPVEQRGDFKEWNYTETHLPVRRVDEHNACITALRAALADAARMKEALVQAEACMSIVEPRSDKAEYLRILGVVRAALGQEESKP